VTADIATALGELRAAGTAGGVDDGTVLDEAAAFAAGICADDGGSTAGAWSTAFGRPASLFAGAAARGRAWRNVPTPTLARLAGDGAAPAYAQALVDLAAAVATIGAPDLKRINAAGFAASAQLRAIAPMPRAVDLIRPLFPVDPPATGTTTAAEPVSAQQQAAASTAAADPAKPLPTLKELLDQLDALIGLAGVKDEIHKQAELLRVDKLRTEKGMKSADVTKHLVFSGNPGTGKTTVARLVAGIYRALGILEKGQLIETDRSGLVAGYVGQTALKTAEVVKSAIGGVLFVDEAYALASDDFGQEAVDTLVKAMEDHRDELVLIVAGYTGEMAIFIASNPGLQSRFRTTIEFPDYTDDELIEIFHSLCADADFSPTKDCDDRLRGLLARQVRDRSFGNGRWVRNQFEAAVVRQAWRLRDTPDPTVDQLRELQADDLEAIAPLTPPAGASPTEVSPPA
jgi:hypothetical protein